MHFASPIPWWLALLATTGIFAFAVAIYRRPLVPLSPARRRSLVTLRALTLALLLLLLCRPVLVLPPVTSGDVVVPVLIDVSRSMRIQDAGGIARLARATIVARAAVEALSASAEVELFSFSDRVAPATLGSLLPEGRRTDIRSALEAIRGRYRGRRIAGIVVLSDGADAAAAEAAPSADAAVPVFAVGIGSPDGVPDREVTGVIANDPRLDQASTDLQVTAVSRGFGREPLQLKLLANGVTIDTRRVVPSADGAPIDERFTVFPDPARASLYTAEIEIAPNEAVAENNTSMIVLSPAGRRRRILALAGAPGYEYSFLLRALQQDPGLEIDSIVRKGKNDANQDTFLVQAGGGRSSLLTSGFPATKEALFAYDALIVANIESDFFSRDQLTRAAEFVSERGGGLLVMGGRSFERRGLTATPLEEVLPVELTDRRGGPLRPGEGEEAGRQDAMALTAEGMRHPVMRIGAKADQLKTLWSTLPPLAASAPLGGPRPGASVLAVTTAPNGALLPVVAVQRYGRGRSMIFAGEASWRWRMMLPAADRRYDYFWRQSLRWLSSDAPETVSIGWPAMPEAGDALVMQVETRDRAFAPVDTANVEVRVTTPTGDTMPLVVRPLGRGRVSASGTLSAPGLYRVQAEARQNGLSLGSDDRWLAVGDNGREFADPRLNEGVLRRLSRESGGRYVRADEASTIFDELARAVPAGALPQQRDLWHEPWAFALVVLLVSAEWMMRRAWGLR